VTATLHAKAGDTAVEGIDGRTFTLTKGGNWSIVFADLPIYRDDQKIVYSVSEVSVPEGYTSRVTGNATEGYTITNTHTPETVNVSGTKTWEDANNQDGLRPSSITINLQANGTKIGDVEVKPDSNGDWKWIFTNLPKYDGVDSSGQPKEIEYTVTENNVLINDTIINNGYVDTDYVLLYHTNFGYPFLDAGLDLDFDNTLTLPANTTPKENIPYAKTIVEPKDVGNEDLFYHFLKEGKVSLTNSNLKIKCVMSYDTQKLPVLLEWKNLFSGDYVLGIEPSTTRFDEYVKKVLTPGQSENYQLNISFSNI
jgi:hypothetical protein